MGALRGGAALASAKAEKRPLIVDFTAEWCGACKEIAKHTFADPRVMEKALAANFVAVKVDATNDEDPQVDAVKGKYKVVGLPTVVIYDSTGQGAEALQRVRRAGALPRRARGHPVA